jgi:hypothetical protein
VQELKAYGERHEGLDELGLALETLRRYSFLQDRTRRITEAIEEVLESLAELQDGICAELGLQCGF